MQPLAARVPVQLQQASLSLLPTPMSNHEVQDVPPWPSLYNPGLEILNIQHNDPVRPGAHYLYRATGRKSVSAPYHRSSDWFYRCFPIYSLLDPNILPPIIRSMRVLCLLELCIPSIKKELVPRKDVPPTLVPTPSVGAIRRRSLIQPHISSVLWLYAHFEH